MNLSRPKAARPLISLVSMIDVLLIMLVFFMVTSTYLNLDMIPMVERSEDAPAGAQTNRAGRSTVLLSLGADGRIALSGKTHSLDELAISLKARQESNPDLQVLILPSNHAKTQTLVSAMDAVTNSGITRLRIVELEARP